MASGSSSLSDINMRIMVIEIKYFSANNTVLHTENCKLQLDLNCSPRELQRLIVQQCGISDSAAKRGFSDHALEMFYVDYIEPPKKHHLFCKPMNKWQC